MPGTPEPDEKVVEVAAYTGSYYSRVFRVGGDEVVIAEAPGKGSTGREVWRVAEHLVR
jgi:Tfp pilus assembly protein PilP